MRGRRKPAVGRAQTEPRAVVLVGSMGAGKTSVGRALGRQLGWTFEDLDERIERRERRKVHEIFRDSGEPTFRRAEHAALKELLKELRAGAGAKRIVALGGGALARRQNAMLIKGSGIPTIFLDADPKELWRRCREQVEQQNIKRPLLGSLQSFQELYEARRPHYLKASFRQETGSRTVAEIAAAIVQALDLGGSGGMRGEKH